jgi:hypothetical protein
VGRADRQLFNGNRMKSKTLANTNVSASEGQKRFRDMASQEKLRFIGKSVLFVLTMGFVFPTLWVD